jgi:hypothetical protein
LRANRDKALAFDPNTIGTWAAIVAAFSATASLVVTFQQYRTANAKLQLDLFEKRFKVFEATMAILAEVLQSRRWSFNRHIDFKRQIAEARCLFPADVTEKMQQVLRVGIEMDNAQAGLDVQQEPGPERAIEVKNRTNAFSFIADEMLALEGLFITHMRILKD